MRISALLLLCAGIASSATVTAGTVDVSFVNARQFADVGNTAWEQEANLQVIERHLKAIGQRWLPANHVLKLNVLDVDLAGTVRYGGHEIRVLRGGADFPRIHLQYTLVVDGRVERSGTEWPTDLNYTRGITGVRYSEPLPYEKRMIDDWFKSRFLSAPGSAG